MPSSAPVNKIKAKRGGWTGGSVFRVRLPGTNKDKPEQGIIKVLDRAAFRSGIDVYSMAKFMSYFLEEIALEVAEGKDVTIPGFGRFYSGLQQRMGAKRVRYTLPRFIASHSFVMQVRERSPMFAYDFDRTVRYAQENLPIYSDVHRKTGQHRRSTNEQMAAHRETIERQAKRVGLKIER